MDAHKALEILVGAIPDEKQSETTSDAADYLFTYIEHYGDVNKPDPA